MAKGFQRSRHRVFGIASSEDSVDHQTLIAHPQSGKFASTSFGFGERRLLRPAHQNERRHRRVDQSIERCFVQCTLLLETGKRSKAGRAAGVGIEKATPCGRELQQA